MSRFIGGTGLFMFNGDWESGNLDKQMAGNVGFFLMPPETAGGKHAAMSAPLTYGIGAKAKNADWQILDDGAAEQERKRHDAQREERSSDLESARARVDQRTREHRRDR